MLSKKYILSINRNREYIIEDLIVSDILTDLRTAKSFKLEDVERINHNITSKEKASHLIDMLLEKDDECFERFLDILGSTYEHLAERLTASINIRTRRDSGTNFGQILIYGGVPDRLVDYIGRKNVEDSLLNELKGDSSKPIVVHGAVGCGKSCIVAYVIHSGEIFPDRYTSVCWMTIGNIKEEEVLTKLRILLAKLDSQSPDPSYQIPDLYKERIIEKVRKQSVLLVLDDVWNSKIMKYFIFPLQYIVTTRQSNLLTEDQAKLIAVPDRFSDEECVRFLEHYLGDQEPDKALARKIIEKSHGNPLHLSMIKNLLKSNNDCRKFIHKLNFDDFPISEIIKDNLEILSEEQRSCYERFAILNEDEWLSSTLLSIYWKLSDMNTLCNLNYFCENHLMTKKWSEEYKCNMYAIHDMHWQYLVEHYNKTDFQREFIDNYTKKYQDWLKIDHKDPYFFTNCARFLHAIEDTETLRKLFTDLSFLASKIVISGISDLLFDYETYRPTMDTDLWDQLEQFFMRHSHRFVNLPVNDLSIKIKKVFTTIIQLSLFENKERSQIYSLANSYKDRSARKDFWSWDNSEPSMKIYEASHMEVIDSIDCNQYGVLLTSEDGRLSLWELKNGKCLFNYKISNEKIILCKFLKKNSLDFVMIEKSGKMRHFDISKLLNCPTSPHKEEDEDDDADYRDSSECSESIQEMDFQSLRRIFRRILIPDFIAKCEISYNDLNKNQNQNQKTRQIYETGSVVDSSDYILLASSTEPSNSSSQFQTLIECYTNKNTLSFDYKVEYQVKKIVHLPNDMEKYYLLDDRGDSVHVLSDIGDEMDKFTFNNEIIYDFIVVKDDVYLAAGRCVYKNHDTTPILSTVCNANITHLSMCSQSKLMALCITNLTVQIWDIVDTKLLYTLKGFECTGAYFELNSNNLITTAQKNVSKWSLDSLKPKNGGEQSDCQNYRYKFLLHTRRTANTVWIVQRYNNEIEFKTYSDNEYSSGPCQVTSKATCFSIERDYAIIGFQDSRIQVYNISQLPQVSHEMTIDSVNNVIELSTCSVDNSHWLAIVYYDVNKIKVLNVSTPDLVYTESKPVEMRQHSKLKLFRTKSNNFLVGLCSDNICYLYRVNVRFEMEQICEQSFKFGSNITDFDVNESGSLLCAATSTGQLQVWSTEQTRRWREDDEINVHIRNCKFRPRNNHEWDLVATLNDNGEVKLVYFKGNEKKINVIIEDSPTTSVGIFPSLTWTSDGEFLIVGDSEIKKWKVDSKPKKSTEFKYPLTRLFTYAGGLRCIGLTNDFICTIDLGGYFYIFRKV